MLDWATGNAPREHDYTHPERHFKGLVPAADPDVRNPNGSNVFPEEFGKDYGIFPPDDVEPETELCWACGWTATEQTTSCYCPRIRIMHARDNMGLWSIGSKWLIRDQPNDRTLGADYMTWKFLKEQPGLTIPLVETMRPLSDPEDPIQFTLISRAQGKQLSAVWCTLTPEQKESYREQMADILKQLRQFTAPFPQRVDGEQLDDHILGLCQRRHSPTCLKMGFTTEEWLENLSEDLRFGLGRSLRTKDPKVIEEKLENLKDNFPRGGPYVLTHADLNMTNIIVKDDKIEAIVDWEMAGYYPWWAEVFASGLGGDMQESEFFEGPKGVWPRVHPDMARASPAFQKVMEHLLPVVRTFKNTPFFAKHVHLEDPPMHGFYKPRFCECHSYGGWIKPVSVGVLTRHQAGSLADLNFN